MNILKRQIHPHVYMTVFATAEIWKQSAHQWMSGLIRCDIPHPHQKKTQSKNTPSVQLSRSVVSDSLPPHESQHTRPPCPSPTPGVHSDSRPVMPSSHLILSRPLLLLPPIPPSIRVFSNESILCMKWPNYWSFSFSISPSNEQSGLISFRMDWLDLLAFQGTLKSLFQHHSPGRVGFVMQTWLLIGCHLFLGGIKPGE